MADGAWCFAWRAVHDGYFFGNTVGQLPLPRQTVDSIPKDAGDQRTSHSRCRHGKKTLESVLHRRTSQSKLFFQSRNILP